MRESVLERHFVREVKLRGGLAIKLAGNIMAGIPDRLVILPIGRVVFVELKTDKGRTSPIQKHVHTMLLDRGCDVQVLYGRTQVDEWLEMI
jgi:hypothetical protein